MIGAWLRGAVAGLVPVIASRLKPPRVIYDIDDRTPYLTRYYLIGRPRMPDRSPPFDTWGSPKEAAIYPDGIGLYLHKFHRGDQDRELHNHPWRWAVSLILAGGYREERRIGSDVIVRDVRPGDLNVIRHGDFHRVDLMPSRPAWSLFLAGPKVSSWGFWDRATDAVIPWREFMEDARKRYASRAPFDTGAGSGAGSGAGVAPARESARKQTETTPGTRAAGTGGTP